MFAIKSGYASCFGPLVGPERASSWIRPKGMVSLDKGDQLDTPAKL
jgi:hypothetical protein